MSDGCKSVCEYFWKWHMRFNSFIAQGKRIGSREIKIDNNF